MHGRIITIIFALSLTAGILLAVFQTVYLNYGYHKWLADNLVAPIGNTDFRLLAEQRKALVAFLLDRTEIERSFYTPEENSHIQDIKLLLIQERIIFRYLVILTLLLTIVYWQRRRRKQTMQLIANVGRALTVSLLLLLVIVPLTFFQLFNLFHQLFFPQGNWLFDPAASLLIQIYPPEFFLFFALGWLFAALITSVFIWLLARLLSK